MNKRDDKMILITGVLPYGGIGAWRQESAFSNPVMNLDAIIELSKIAEEGKFHSMFLADGNAVRDMESTGIFEALGFAHRPATFEPATLMAALSQHTEHIGLFLTLSTTYNEPYTVARQFASIDHLSHGRTVWNVVTTSYPGDSKNFGDAPFPEREQRYERAIEFLDVCKDLWDSWADDAFPQDKTSGKFLDADRVRKIDHHGAHFDVQGPLNVARMPQGYPVFFMAGASEPGREFAAKMADGVFSNANSKEQSKELRDDLHRRMAKYGRTPDQIKVIPGIRVTVAETHEEAARVRKDLAKLVAPALGLEFLSAHLMQDLSAYDLDAPFPKLSDEELQSGLRTHYDNLYAHATEHEWTLRETIEHELGGTGEEPFTGTAEEVADQMQEWFEYGACDGFNVNTPTIPEGMRKVVDLLVPELQRRGLFHEDYEGASARENMGLPIPVNSYFEQLSA